MSVDPNHTKGEYLRCPLYSKIRFELRVGFGSKNTWQNCPKANKARIKEWLKENKVKAVPFDKGCGFALMSDKCFDEKINNILKGRQLEVKKRRSNSRPIEQIEQERINKALDGLKKQQKYLRACKII